jgi:hypothetical protein
LERASYKICRSVTQCIHGYGVVSWPPMNGAKMVSSPSAIARSNMTSIGASNN